MTSDQSEFGTSIRGYDRDAVDEAIRLLRKELLQVGSLNAQLAAELREKSALAEDLQQKLDEAAAPNYASVGTRAALILSTAEEQSLQIVADAEVERERILADLETELAALRDEAKEYYDSVVTEAQRRAERLQAQAKADYDQTLKEASAAAADLVDEATREAIRTWAKEKQFDVVEVLFNYSKNVATQIIQTEQLLPLVASESGEKASSVDYIFEPSEEEIISELIPKSIKLSIFRALLESNSSEHGARMTAMDKATDNAGELIKALKLEYNRSRQAAITKEILEIVGGAEALNA